MQPPTGRQCKNDRRAAEEEETRRPPESARPVTNAPEFPLLAQAGLQPCHPHLCLPGQEGARHKGHDQ